LLNRCLHEDDIPDDVRAAGALVLLYGLQLSRIVELTNSHLHRRHAVGGEETVGGMSVSLTGPEITVPPSLAAILTRLPVRGPHPRTRPLIGGAPGWLFPGFTATGHLSAATMSKHMKDYGIPTRSARNAALIALAGGTTHLTGERPLRHQHLHGDELGPPCGKGLERLPRNTPGALG
jgi:hypothetical protein